MENVDAAITAIQNTAEIKRNIDSLKETEGWGKLSDEQRGMISASLLRSNRAFRKTDPASADAIGNDIWDLSKMVYPEKQLLEGFLLKQITPGTTSRVEYQYNPDKRKYATSQNLIAETTCHMAISGLELGHFLKDEKELPSNFFKAKYVHINELDGKEIANELKKSFTNTGFPYIVHVTKFANTDADEDTPMYANHSFLVLGHNKENEILVWHKVNTGQPYRVSTLDKVCDKDSYCDSWGIREIRNI